MRLLPLTPIRNLLVQNCPFHLSDDAIISLRDILEDIIHMTCYGSIQEFEELNSNRERQGLPRLKRLNSWAIKRAAKKIINDSTILSMGSQPAMIGSLDGEKMLESKSVIKLDTDTWITGGTDDKR